MTTPNRHYTQFLLTRPVRRILMCTLIAGFFIASPIIILYTAGFRYDFVHHHFVNTGVISIDILPKDALASLNGILVDKKMPIRLSNRAPGVYNLKIEKTGYMPWGKNITISSNQTTYIKDVTLLKNFNPVSILPEINGVMEIAGSQHTKNILILNHINEIYEISTFDTINNSILPILRIPTHKKPEISISPFHNFAYVLITEETGGKTVYLIPLDTPENFRIYPLTSGKQLDIMWNINSELEPLYIKQGDIIQKINKNNIFEVYGQTTSTLWFVDQKNALWIYNENTIQNTVTNISYPIDKTITRIVDINDNRLILKTDNDTVVINRDTIEKQVVPGVQYFFNIQTNEWWVWNEWELFSIYENGSTNLIYRGGEKIKNVQLLDQAGYILFSTENNLKTLNPGYNVGYELLAYPANSVYNNLKQRELIYISSQDQKIYKSLY